MFHSLKKAVPQSWKNLFHLAQAVAASAVYGFPSKKLDIIAVTGTDGKTTTVQMIGAILRQAEKKTAVSSTINFRIGDKEWVNKTKFTTLSAFAVQKFLRQAVSAGCSHAVLEVSSHSIDQKRIWGIRPRIAVITNVTREHLDYHGTMERYREAKLGLFLVSDDIAVNADMENPSQFLSAGKRRRVAFGTDSDRLKLVGSVDETVLAHDIAIRMDGTDFMVGTTSFRLFLPGRFNVENAMAAIGASKLAGIDLETCSQALAGIKNVPGRMEFVQNEHGFNILIDYALTPDALGKLYALIQDIRGTEGRVISVFGACGDRDRGKRPIMGSIVDRFADVIILTDEDPYFENPQDIIREIASGIPNRTIGENLWIIPDRAEAIGKSFDIAKKGDFVIITGKGAEETMAIGSQRIPWNDKRVVSEILAKKEVKRT